MLPKAGTKYLLESDDNLTYYFKKKLKPAALSLLLFYFL